MTKELHDKSTPALLRELAVLIEKDEAPDFFFCMAKDYNDLRSAYIATDHVFSLTGLMHYKIGCIEKEYMNDD